MKPFRCLAILLFVSLPLAKDAEPYKPQDGDILFQTSLSAQSLAVQKATHSPYGHMGILFLSSRGPEVLEAVEPVRLTSLAQWVAQGSGHHYVVKRLIESRRELTPSAIERLHSLGRALIGKHYDLVFQWSDERMYCSELVWKLFKRALNLEIGRLQRISDFDLSDPVVWAKVLERWGGPPPATEVVVSPGEMFTSTLLTTVYQQ